jgi:hypothetical protein
MLPKLPALSVVKIGAFVMPLPGEASRLVTRLAVLTASMAASRMMITVACHCRTAPATGPA